MDGSTFAQDVIPNAVNAVLGTQFLDAVRDLDVLVGHAVAAGPLDRAALSHVPRSVRDRLGEQDVRDAFAGWAEAHAGRTKILADMRDQMLSGEATTDVELLVCIDFADTVFCSLTRTLSHLAVPQPA